MPPSIELLRISVAKDKSSSFALFRTSLDCDGEYETTASVNRLNSRIIKIKMCECDYCPNTMDSLLPASVDRCLAVQYVCVLNKFLAFVYTMNVKTSDMYGHDVYGPDVYGFDVNASGLVYAFPDDRIVDAMTPNPEENMYLRTKAKGTRKDRRKEDKKEKMLHTAPSYCAGAAAGRCLAE